MPTNCDRAENNSVKQNWEVWVSGEWDVGRLFPTMRIREIILANQDLSSILRNGKNTDVPG